MNSSVRDQTAKTPSWVLDGDWIVHFSVRRKRGRSLEVRSSMQLLNALLLGQTPGLRQLFGFALRDVFQGDIFQTSGVEANERKEFDD